ncbi:19844_t:CDS:2 [Cetraspora pellucida]|uniref:19844_t:CDS:1 n=1 Tax=Cetraspora pellucida TaxID=1433469 RepID=A0A9N9G5G0_9GLOM|nr:19844_t:CDS:2 [Cetraspora pellucida]
MAYSLLYRSSYQKQTYPICTFRRIARNIIACLLLAFLIAILLSHLNSFHINPTSLHIQEFSKHKTNIGNISNIVVVIDGDQQANSLLPIYCKLTKRTENVYTHVIVTGQGRGISGAKLIRLNTLVPNCDVSVYDLGISVNENILPLVFQGISHVLGQIRPDVLIYIKDPENEAMRGVNAAFVAASQTISITKIAIPIEHTKHLMWITDLSIEALKNWNTPNIQIQVITQNRPESLERLMQSLNSSIYFGDDVYLTINVDRKADPVTIKYCQTFKWPFGYLSVRHRVVQGGLIASVVESYYPTTNDEYAVILEDDIEISPFFYVWSKYTILKYKYGVDRSLSGRMYGVSLYDTKFNEIHAAGRRPFNPAHVLKDTKYPNQSPYLSQNPCSWGALFFPEIWREFHTYQNARLRNKRQRKVVVPNSRSNSWGKSWKRYLIELAYSRGYVMLYPNYKDSVSFSTNHAEKGVHFHLSGERKRLWLLPLMKEDILLEGLPDGHLPSYKDLPVMDLWGRVVSTEELIRRGRKFHSKISQCPPRNDDKLTYDPQDLLCVKNNGSTIKNERITEKKNSVEEPIIEENVENNLI